MDRKSQGMCAWYRALVVITILSVALAASIFNARSLVADSDKFKSTAANALSPYIINPAGRFGHSAVWTGQEMLVWGGLDLSLPEGSYRFDGAGYDAERNRWSWITLDGAPSPRSAHGAVWTGEEMIVWGGSLPNNGGARYNRLTNRWIPLNSTGEPSPRYGLSTVWTGNEMIVWGGSNGFYPFPADGARYDPVADKWLPISSVGAPRGREGHSTVWTGTEMIVWGGHTENEDVGDGARYDPSTDRWTPISMNGAPRARSRHHAVWTGKEMIIWGGASNSWLVGDGARYDPVTDQWSPVSSVGAPGARADATAIWTGSEMVVWGGLGEPPCNGGCEINDGYRYDPLSDRWAPISRRNAPSRRSRHSAVWTGSEMMVWGGQVEGVSLRFGGRWNAATDTWRSIPWFWGTALPIVQRDDSPPSNVQLPPVSDDFSDENSGWPIIEDTPESQGYQGGEYFFVIRPADWFFSAGRSLIASDFQVEVDARASGHLNGSYGFFFNSSAPGSYFFFVSNGRFELHKMNRYLGTWQTLIAPTFHPAIKAGNQTNRLRVIRRGSNITLYANGQQIGYANDGTLGRGFVGMTVLSSARDFQARFDNFQIQFGNYNAASSELGLVRSINGLDTEFLPFGLGSSAIEMPSGVIER